MPATDLIVCHAKNPSFRSDDHPVFPDDFTVVAVVTVAEGDFTDGGLLDHAFQETNHIHQSWWENESVTLQQESRSTSVGDVVVLPGGRAFRCESTGWNLIEGNPESAA